MPGAVRRRMVSTSSRVRPGTMRPDKARAACWADDARPPIVRALFHDQAQADKLAHTAERRQNPGKDRHAVEACHAP